MFVLNKRVGMDEEKFEKYLVTNIIRLHTDLADVQGKNLLMKNDTGPGCNSKQLMCARVHNLGV